MFLGSKSEESMPFFKSNLSETQSSVKQAWLRENTVLPAQNTHYGYVGFYFVSKVTFKKSITIIIKK